jgi:hypothetical protein
VLVTNLGLAPSAPGNTLTRSAHDTVEVHAVDTDRRVVLDTEINVLRDTEPKVASLGEVALAELVLLDLETTLENFLSLGTTDGDVDSDLLVTTDTESADGVAGLACKNLALGEILCPSLCPFLYAGPQSRCDIL